jgi:hypothetical protein
MSTEMVSVATRLKADLARNRLVLPASSSKFITAEAGKFVLPSGQSNTTLSGIIIDFRRVFTYYKAAFNPKVKAKPDCFAIGLDELTDMRSNAASPKPQCGEFCGSCPHNQWKSGAGGGKRCKNAIRLAILPPNSLDAGSLLVLTLPPTTLRNFTAYNTALANEGYHPAQVISTISFDPDVTYSKFLFEQSGMTPDIELLNAALIAAPDLLESVAGLVLEDE